MTVGQKLLENFYKSVKFQNPGLAADIRADVVTVGLGGLGADKSFGAEAADRLRRAAVDMPVVFERTLYAALEELGY